MISPPTAWPALGRRRALVRFPATSCLTSVPQLAAGNRAARGPALRTLLKRSRRRREAFQTVGVADEHRLKRPWIIDPFRPRSTRRRHVERNCPDDAERAPPLRWRLTAPNSAPGAAPSASFLLRSAPEGPAEPDGQEEIRRAGAEVQEGPDQRSSRARSRPRIRVGAAPPAGGLLEEAQNPVIPDQYRRTGH